MDLLSAVPGRYARNALSDYAPELLITLRGLRGAVWYVDSNKAGGVAGQGASMADAVLTLNAAVALASAGDIIMVANGHAETIIAAGGITLSKAGVQIIGLGVGRNRPTISYTTSTAGTFLVSGANVRIVNFVFRPVGIDAVVTAVSVTAADVEFIGCDFEHATAAGQAVTVITTTAAADRLGVYGCRFYGTTDAGTVAAVTIVGGDGIRIENNLFLGAYTSGTGAISQITTTSTNMTILGNVIANQTASSTKAITLTASTTAFIMNNRMQVLSGTAPITAAAGYVGGNYYCAAAGVTAGTLL